MKIAGIILVIAGIFILIFTGISFKQEETVLDVNDYEITREEEKEITWPRWVGGVVVAAGVVVYIAGRKR